MSEKRILIIDDDTELSLLIRDMLSDNGYGVLLARNLDEAYRLLGEESVHLILLDINLPDGTGFELCRELRRVSTVPIIFASARTSEDDKVIGLDMGGDDYIAKPYSLKELMSRIGSLIRRAYRFEKSEEYVELKAGRDNEIRVDIAGHRVERNKSIVSLSMKEYDLLVYMVRHRGETLSKEQLVSDVWGAFSQVEPSTLTVHIRWLREKLEKNPSNPLLIRTVWGIGYMLEESADE